MKVKAVKSKYRNCLGCIGEDGTRICSKIHLAYRKKFNGHLSCSIKKMIWLEKQEPKEKGIEYHKRCHDCGRFVKKSEWVRKDHLWKKHALCGNCLSGYTGPYDY